MAAASSETRLRVAVIGGGFSGLAAAHRLRELSPSVQVTLYEGSDRLGGVVRTDQDDGFLLEHGADMFTTKDPWAMDLCRRLDFSDELINTNSRYARAFVVRGGRLYPVPEGFTLMTPGRMWPVAKSPLLSVGGKLRMAAEYFVPPRRDGEDESLQQFVTRRLGQEAYERLVQPLIGGIYTADPTKLSMQAALPQFVQMEQEHGGLIRAIRRAARNGRSTTSGDAKSAPARETSAGARYGLFVAPRRGMETFLQRIAERLPSESVRLSSPVQSVTRAADGSWKIQITGAAGPVTADRLLVAAPAYRAGDLLSDSSPELASELRSIPYATASVVVVGLRRDQVQHPLDGFGIVVPQCENRGILAASLSSVKFDGRAPDGHVLMRVFIGGACQPELAELPDRELESLALRELRELLGVSGPPRLLRVVRWRRAMPQYHVGHLARIARIESLLAGVPNLALAGNAYRGVGIPFCIRSGEQAAEKLVLGSERL